MSHLVLKDEQDNYYKNIYIAGAGTFLQKINLELEFIKDKTLSIRRINSSFSSIFVLDPKINKMPLSLWYIVLDLYTYFLNINNEICIHLYYNFINNTWKIFIPKQIITPVSVFTHQSLFCDISTGQDFTNNDYILSDYKKIGDSHLHPMGLSKFSHQDDDDELFKPGFHILVYNSLDDNNQSTESYPNLGHLGSFTYSGKRYYFNFLDKLIDHSNTGDRQVLYKDPHGNNILFHPNILRLIEISQFVPKKYRGSQMSDFNIKPIITCK